MGKEAGFPEQPPAGKGSGVYRVYPLWLQRSLRCQARKAGATSPASPFLHNTREPPSLPSACSADLLLPVAAWASSAPCFHRQVFPRAMGPLRNCRKHRPGEVSAWVFTRFDNAGSSKNSRKKALCLLKNMGGIGHPWRPTCIFAVLFGLGLVRSSPSDSRVQRQLEARCQLNHSHVRIAFRIKFGPPALFQQAAE